MSFCPIKNLLKIVLNIWQMTLGERELEECSNCKNISRLKYSELKIPSKSIDFIAYLHVGITVSVSKVLSLGSVIL